MRWIMEEPDGVGMDFRLPIIRVVVSFLLALGVLILQNTSWAERTFLVFLEQELFDYTAEARENAVGGPAPPVAVLTFDEAARQAYFKDRLPGSPQSAWPNLTPLAVAERAMRLARDGGAKIVIIDVELSPIGYVRPQEEIDAFRAWLVGWAQNPDAPLAVFVRARQPGAQWPGFPVLTPSLFDDLVSVAPNLAFASADAYLDQDGVARHAAYYACAAREGAPERGIALPHAGLYAQAAAAGLSPAESKRAVDAAMTGNGLCAAPDRDSGFELTLAGRTYVFPDRRGFIDYHLNLPRFGGVGAAAVADGWGRPGARAIVEATGDPLLISREAPGEPLPIMEGAIVILSSSLAYYADEHYSPLGRIPGSVIVANVARGLALHGPILSLSQTLQAAILFGIVLTINAYYFVFAHLHHRALSFERRRRLAGDRGPVGIWRLLTGPVASKLFASVLIFVVSLWAGYLVLNVGVWEAFVTPAMAASLILSLDDPLEVVVGHGKKSNDQ